MRLTYALEEHHSETLEEAKALVGGKAASLGVMTRELGIPVPPGFAITTATCRAFLADGWPAGLDAELRERMSEIEAKAGRRFGDSSDPLLVSVRSGAPISMPGMMDTILNLGLNEATAPGLGRAAGSEPFARACLERLHASFRSIVGAEVPGDPWRQLRLAIEAVFRSWNSDRAVTYRCREGIPDDLGTAVTVQAMVFGNRGPTSATGVVFTRNPATGEPDLYGDILFNAQGEDVVAGTHETEPIGVLDVRMPALAAQLRDYTDRLERHHADLCEIEFTIEDRQLWMLQVRVGKRSPQAALRIAIDMADDPMFPLTRAEAVARVVSLLANPPRIAIVQADHPEPLATGLPASPGLASGPIATSPEAAEEAAEHGHPAVLVRAETSPGDVHGMAKAAGILTSRGGLASHAAVVARGWGIPAVVGATDVEVRDGEVIVAGRSLRAGDVITIDGSTGGVFAGAIEGSTRIVPEAAVLRAWAHELGIDVSGERPAPEQPKEARPARLVTPEACIRTVAVKGLAPLESLVAAWSSTAEDLQPILDGLVHDGILATTAGAYKLTPSGTARADELLEAERRAWGEEAASAALDAFIDLDGRMKATVTAWQLRDPDAQVVNDHSDGAYDRVVLDGLAALHDDAAAWLTWAESGLPRLADYRVRLGRAIDRVHAGEDRYVASPRVDSYHSIWFELHEDLIQLAGRSRAEEVAAGRA